MKHSVISNDGTTILFNPDFPYSPNLDWFSFEFWQQQNAITGQSKGRNITWFFQLGEHEFVLRHYYRGGLIGKLINDSFLGFSANSARCSKEFELLLQLTEMKLPVPKPLAAQIIKTTPISYRADLIIERIPNAADLYHLLQQQSLEKHLWQQLGSLIAKFHNQGVYHDDLNIHNIMLDGDNNFWLIDFDKGNIRKPELQWQQSNMDRLLRSFKKEKNKHPQMHWKTDEWELLINAYQDNIESS